MKNYVNFVNDHSGSMGSLRRAAISDYNANITATKDAASKEMLDTVVSVIGVGFERNPTVRRQVVISNPHVLRPISEWAAESNTPLYDGIGEMITLMESLPDASDPQVSFLTIITTDGAENASSKWNKARLADKIQQLQRSDRWTFVLRIPRGHRHQVTGLGVPDGNIQEWDVSEAGMAASTVQTTQAMTQFYTSRAAGSKSSNVFYTSTQGVDTSKLSDISAETSLYIVDPTQQGMWIKDFILTKRMEYLIGAAFYQLSKSESKVSPSKLILIREKTTGKVYAGPDARKMLGLDTVNNARLHPNHGNGPFDIFIQSESVNRKLVGGSGVLYWAAKGRKMTQADLDKYAPKAEAPAVPQLAPVPANGKPTPSPIPVQKKGPLIDGKPVQFFQHRSMARDHGRPLGKKAMDAREFGHVVKGERWFVYL